MNTRKSVLSAAIVGCLAFSAHAQQTQTPQDLDTITVVGIRASLEKSLDTKRNNVGVSEAITAEDIGKFPSTNVAEALSQIPGVTLDRRFGQGERVSIDGTDPSLNLSFLDGHPVAQAIWLYGEQPNRGFDYTLLSPQILGRAEIIKSSEARLTEGSLGGTVLMHTRQPLDLKKNEVAASVGYSYSQKASEGKPNASALYSWKNDDETFGIAVSAQHYEEAIDRQGIEVFGYAKASSFTNATGVAGDVDVPNSINAAWFQQERKRDSAVVNLQFKPNEDLEFNLSGLYIKENFDNYNQSMYSFLTWNDGTRNAIDQLGGVRNGVATSGHSNANADATSGTVIYDNNVRESEVTTKGLDLRGAWKGEGWGVNGQVGQSKSENKNLAQYFIEPVYNGAYSWSVDDGLTFDDPAGARDPANWGAPGGWLGNNGIFATDSKDTYAQLDFNVQFDSVFNQLQFGVRHGKHEENFELNVYGGVRTGTLADVGTIGLTDGIQGFGDDQSHHIQVGRDNVLAWVKGSPLDFANPDPSSYLNNSWALEQTNNAAYAQLNFSNGPLRGNVGVRYVDSKTDGSGFVYGGTPTLTDLDSKWQTRSKKEDFVLPSVSLAWDTDSDWVFRFSGAKVIAWAPYNQMVNNTFLNDTQLTGSGGNADLSPYESWNFNASAEYYFAPQAVVAWSIFYKKIENYIDTSATIERQYNSIRDTSPLTWDSIVGTNGCTADGYCDYSIQRPRNAGSGHVKGFNLSFQQPFGESGFGLTGNYTYANGENNTGDPLPYQSRNAVAFSPYYEKGPLNARLTYNWRDSYLAGGYVAGAAPASVDDYAELGASIGYTFNENWSLTVDAQNLLDETYFQYLGDKEHLAGKYKSGRRYMATVHFKF
ncbi:TonB-dependent receptor [Stenotrophomonas sp. Betaine-02u-21]|uniref:TonB-dependent receptor n=1 Tax=unclassified Stenotrophomonas TaxID=196198 RepID=UPI000C320604|nr:MULTISPECIES: TonB-dependent receptor [unclassified Stenotrophomonas]PKH71233.1 TonB-dependent receptor [Stenotrophomonas sp. Betaine-02u-21]PKH72392.1 TonB-dependent receptor [Stenotrophomonas sp. Betaine-02u-23]PKH96939.1 TonB-dependent receptor [Stenotrophomonas sp. Bg11-02]